MRGARYTHRTTPDVAGSGRVTADRPRASAAVFRNGHREILVVRHRRRDGSEYWQLPGGGLNPNESAENAAIRELKEETGLEGHIVRELFRIPYKYGKSTTFLAKVPGGGEPILGIDPEEQMEDHQKLIEVAWRPFDASLGSTEVRVMLALPKSLFDYS